MVRRKASALVQNRAAKAVSLSAPVGGWNARDSLADMAANDAVTLVNFFPDVGSVNLRGGSTDHVTGIPGTVETLMAYTSGTAGKLFAVANTPSSIFDVTSAGVVGAAVVTGLSNGRWEYTNVTTAGGSYIYAVNGVDAPLLYDGTTWAAITAISPIAITGVTTTALSNVALFKSRVWFVQKQSLKAWYLPTSAVGGVANALDLSAIARQGGYLVAVATWTIDAGYGVDDNLVFITSKGEVIVYRGTDPASSATWALAGVWALGTPIGTRCLMKYGGDLLILTLNGLVPLASALQSSRLDPRIAVTDKISGAFSAAASTYGASFGWEMLFSAQNSALIVNVPISVTAQEQFVMNTDTQSWARFTGWAASCWENLNDLPYFGTVGKVVKAWTLTYQDGNNNINTQVLQAFNYFGSRGSIKYYTRARLNVLTNGTPSVNATINVDFDIAPPTVPIVVIVPTSSPLWGVGVWGLSLWGQSLFISNNWQGVNGIGYCASVAVSSSTRNINIQWTATDIVYQSGWSGI